MGLDPVRHGKLLHDQRDPECPVTVEADIVGPPGVALDEDLRKTCLGESMEAQGIYQLLPSTLCALQQIFPGSNIDAAPFGSLSAPHNQPRLHVQIGA